MVNLVMVLLVLMLVTGGNDIILSILAAIVVADLVMTVLGKPLIPPGPIAKDLFPQLQVMEDEEKRRKALK